MNPICGRFSWRYQKNEQFLNSILFRNSPDFVLQANPDPPEGEIPVFVFHDVSTKDFEEKCLHLARNGYRTVTGDEFIRLMQNGGDPVRKTVALSFDDGLKYVWTIAFPLLKKYGLQAICFLNPGCIPENGLGIRPNLEDVWKGEATPEDMLPNGHGDSGLANWKEIRAMHESGVIDFQSHTMYHSLVFTSPQLFDFYHPDYKTSPYGVENLHIPIYRSNGRDIVSRDPILGMPIYQSKPRMSAECRYFDDEDIRAMCVEFVEKEGKGFFDGKDWREVLKSMIAHRRSRGSVNERYESPEERDLALLEDMRNSKAAIEERLPGKEVTHLCYPWFEGSRFAVSASKKAGYITNYNGFIWGKPTNRPGSDPFRVVRIGEEFLLRFPGEGRRSLRTIILEKINARAAEGSAESIQYNSILASLVSQFFGARSAGKHK